MNNFIWSASRRALPLVLIGVVLLSCQKNDNTVAIPKTITDQILEDPQFSLLRAAMTYAGVSDNLKGGNLTLLAPNDAAFQASGIASPAAITALPKEQVKDLLMYHVLYAPVSSGEIPVGTNSVTTSNKGTAFVTRTSSGTIYVNGAKIVQPDVVVSNGYLHILDRMLTPPAGTVLTAIQNNPNLTFLSAAVRRIGSTNSTLLATLSNASSTNLITVFAPNDDAFRAAGYKTVSAIESANVQTLTNLLSYHVVSGVLFSNQLQTGAVNTLSGSNRLNVSVLNGTVSVKGNKNATAAALKQADIPVTNGVVHVIDQVLLP